uniref:Uncharacterized protein n=1 Tax=Ditylenchus dipsaci TaxID=166011 RepID=A0A915EG10_9BILA
MSKERLKTHEGEQGRHEDGPIRTRIDPEHRGAPDHRSIGIQKRKLKWGYAGSGIQMRICSYPVRVTPAVMPGSPRWCCPGSDARLTQVVGGHPDGDAQEVGNQVAI